MSTDKDQDREVQALVNARSIALVQRNFREADRIADLLTAKGVVLSDSADGLTEWEWKR